MEKVDTNLQVGGVVISLRGHDKDRMYVILSIDKDFSYLVDGEYRCLSNPKRKRLKHLKLTHFNSIDEKTLGAMHDFEIKKYLKDLQKSVEK